MGEVRIVLYLPVKWAINPNPPSPISSVYGMETFKLY